MSKQDRQGVRTPADLEMKYRFGKVFKNQAKENASQKSQLFRQNLTMSEFISLATASLEALRRDMDGAEEKIAALRQDLQALEGSTEEKMNAQDVRLTAAENSLGGHSDRLTAVENDLAGLNDRMTEAIAALEGRVAALEAKEES